MSWCTLTLSVQDGDRPLHAGDVLEGEVTIQITRAGRCDGLRVELLWFGRWAKATPASGR
ncbi:MAG: hypothetical protein IPN01_07050 [Deltaproteobacteria bacterium]|nr:hypothetical protein [Deltaproteobacteria bacterium]